MHAFAKAAGVANIVLHAPPLPIPYGTHHSKAFVVEYKQGLRVIVHTANLVYSDNNYKTQGLWVQDFPKKVGFMTLQSPSAALLVDYLQSWSISSALHLCKLVFWVDKKQTDLSCIRLLSLLIVWQDCHSPSTSRFEKSLADYLAALKLPGPAGRHALKLCRDHDFSSARVHLLPSVPGYHQGASEPVSPCF